MAAELPAWYRQKREGVEDLFRRILTERNHDPSGYMRVTSPSGAYSLEIARYKTGPNTWNYSNGIVRRIRDGAVLADIKRNYSEFPYAWVSRGSREYLVCGEDYQGYSVVDLGDGLTFVYIPPEAERGAGFCWARIQPSPAGGFLLIEGCLWAGPFVLRLHDFSSPNVLPLPLVAKLDYLCGDPYEDAIELKGEWLAEDRLRITGSVRRSGSDESVLYNTSHDVGELIGKKVGL